MKYLLYGENNVINELNNSLDGFNKLNAEFIKPRILDDSYNVDLGIGIELLEEGDIVCALNDNEYDYLKNIKIHGCDVYNYELLVADLLNEGLVIKPNKISIDACTLCQLDCMDCYMRKKNYDGVGAGTLSIENLIKFVDNNKYIKQIELSNNGEALLAPDLILMLEQLYKRGIKASFWNGVNLNTASSELLEAIVKYKVVGMTASIDGATQSVYEEYRRNGKIDNVLNNIKIINDYKKKYNSNYPELRWQYIVMSHNERDILRAKELAKQYNMNIVFKSNWGEYNKTTNSEYVKRITGCNNLVRDKETFRWGDRCRQLVLFPHINWDGRLLGCCSSHSYDFGINVFEEGLVKAINSEKYRKCIIDVFTRQKDIEDGTPCNKCLFYDKYIRYS